MTSTIRDLERELLQETGGRLVKFGFSPRPRGQTFDRKMDFGRVSVHLSFIKHKMDFDVTVDVAVRFDAVEDLVHRSSGFPSNQAKKPQTSTLGVELGNLERGEPFRFTIATSDDITRTADGIVEKLETVGLPYLDRYSRIEAAYEVLSRDDRDVWLHSPIDVERAKRACALLVVMGRDSEVSVVGERKLTFLRSMNDPSAPLFAKFLSELASSK